MRVRPASGRSTAFLIELIVSILFFALASGVCVKLFAAAHLQSEGSKQLSTAVTAAQTAAECFKAGDGTAGELAAMLGGSAGDHSVSCIMDEQGKALTQTEDGRYLMIIEISEGDTLTATITVYHSDDSLTSSAHQPELIYTLETKRQK